MASPQTTMRQKLNEYAKSVAKAEGFRLPPIRVGFVSDASRMRGNTTISFMLGAVSVHVFVVADDWMKAKWVMTHELAHVQAGINIRYTSTGRTVRDSHGESFYITFWKLAMKYGVNLPFALERESKYKSRNALKFAKQAGVPGAYTQARKVHARKAEVKQWNKIYNQPDGTLVKVMGNIGEFRIIGGNLVFNSFR